MLLCVVYFRVIFFLHHLFLLMFAVYTLSMWHYMVPKVRKVFSEESPPSLPPQPLQVTNLINFRLLPVLFLSQRTYSFPYFPFFLTQKVVYYAYNRYFSTLLFSLNNISWKTLHISSEIFLIVFIAAYNVHWVNVSYFFQPLYSLVGCL